MKSSDTIRKIRFQRLLHKIFTIYLPKFVITVLVLSILFVVFSFFKSSNYFAIKHVDVSGLNKYVSSADFTNVANSLFMDKNILSIKLSDSEKSLKTTFLGIDDLKITKKFPDKLKIEVKERYPVAIISDSTQTKYLIDSDGYVLGLVGDSYYDLPVVTFTEALHVGQFIEKDLIPITLEILNSATKENVNISSISFTPAYTNFYVREGASVLLSNTKDIGESMKIVSKFVKQAVLEGKSISKIDLRYTKVIVLY